MNLRPGDPWVFLDLSDGTSLPALGIQPGIAKQQRHRRRPRPAGARREPAAPARATRTDPGGTRVEPTRGRRPCRTGPCLDYSGGGGAVVAPRLAAPGPRGPRGSLRLEE